MECAWVEDNLSAYIDGELTKADRDAVRRHLRTCPRCQEQASGVVFVRQQVRRVRAWVPREMFNLFIQFLLWTQPELDEKTEPTHPQARTIHPR